MDAYPLLLAVLGLSVLGAAVLPRVINRLPISLPMVIVGIGMLIFSLPLSLDGPRPGADDDAAERLTELVVIVVLLRAGGGGQQEGQERQGRKAAAGEGTHHRSTPWVREPGMGRPSIRSRSIAA
jgi:hypothetical protein